MLANMLNDCHMPPLKKGHSPYNLKMIQRSPIKIEGKGIPGRGTRNNSSEWWEQLGGYELQKE